MSFQALSWAIHVKVGHSPSKHVLTILANYADEAGECFPSVERLVAETELADRTVRMCLAKLEELGLLERVRSRRADGTMTRTRYRLSMSERPAKSQDEKPAKPARQTAPDIGKPTSDHRHVVPLGHRHVVPEPPARGASGHIRNNHQEEPIEKEARANASSREDERAALSDPRSDLAFMEFMGRWPTGKTDDLGRAYAAWTKLSDEDRKRALEGIDPYRVASRAAGRTILCASSTYLRDRSWDRVAPASTASAAVAGATVSIPAFSLAWWVVLHARRQRGERVALMVQQAAEGRGWTVRQGDVPTVDDERAMVRLDTASDEFASWCSALTSEGIHLPQITVPYVWMPTMIPLSVARALAGPSNAMDVVR